MAKIIAAQNERVFQIKEWLGLHESADGDTNLKLGEGPVCRNFKITQDKKLKKRPGSKLMFRPPDNDWGVCQGLWSGVVGQREEVLGIFGGYLYRLWCDHVVDGHQKETWEAVKIGDLNPSDHGRGLRVTIFGFNGKVYISHLSWYYVYDEAGLRAVDPYVPLIEIAVTPLGAGTLLEQVNKLTTKRRVWLSPDGNATVFQLPEKLITSVEYAKLTADGSAVAYSANLQAGEVTFASAPAQGINTIEVCYSTGSIDPVFSQPYVEFYNGDQDNRVFLYGSSNKAYYSGINYNGEPDATYFPDLNEIEVGDSGSKITGLIRYNSRLLCFKEDSTYTIQYGQYMLEDGSITPAFYLTPVHKSIGNEAPGQVQLVMNSPISIHGGAAYSWTGTSFGNMTADERQVKRISDRVYDTLNSFSRASIRCFDDNDHSEYYIIDTTQDKALVWNYAADAWYLYTGLDMRHPMLFHGEFYFASAQTGGARKPCVCQLDSDVPYDERDNGDRDSIDCRWESGHMSFGADYQRKYSAMLWVGIKPASHGEVWVTVQTDRNGSMTEKVVGHSWASFANANFAAWSFSTSHRPKLRRLKIKAKKFVYYKLIFYTNTNDSTATVTASDIRVRFTGYAK